MDETQTSPAQDANSASPPEGSQDAVPAHRHPTFIERVEALLKGRRKPGNAVSEPVVEDLRSVAAEQDQLRKKMQELSETVQTAQAGLLQAQGRADALLQVLHRLETAAEK